MYVRRNIGVKITGKLRPAGIRLGSMKVLCPFDIPTLQPSTKISQSLELPTQNYITGKLIPFHLPSRPSPHYPPSQKKNTAHEKKELEKI